MYVKEQSKDNQRTKLFVGRAHHTPSKQTQTSKEPVAAEHDKKTNVSSLKGYKTYESIRNKVMSSHVNQPVTNQLTGKTKHKVSIAI